MELDQLTGRYVRLRQELAAAYASLPWRDGHIDRLANDLASVERELSTASHAGESFAVSMRPIENESQTK